ncbi:MAG: glycosyltransferase family 25 protein [Desulfuromonadaceae bacterium]|nr:glycosyltransferase family 25 protein [Desulfuromonadaceae bacterium]
MTMPIFVVNLAESTERKERVQEQLDRIGLQAEFFPAVRGKSLNAAELATHYDNSIFFRPLSPGEIGCALSHVFIYKEIIERKYDYCLILEDDIVIDSRISKVLDSIKTIVNPSSPEIILLTSLKEFSENDAIPLNVDNFRMVPVIRAGCTHGYIITNAGARALYDFCYPIRKPADWWEIVQHLITLRGVDPFVIDWDTTSFESLITAGRVTSGNKGKKIGYFYKKITNRISARFVWWKLRWKHGIVLRTILGKTSSHIN